MSYDIFSVPNPLGGTFISGLSSRIFGPNANLLLWTEQFDNAVWAKTLATVNANAGADPLAGATADEIIFTGAASKLEQDSGISASSGSGTTTRTLTDSFQRFSITTVFDIGTYTFSFWAREPSALGSDFGLVLTIVGGKIVCRIRDVGDAVTIHVWGAKLERYGSATGTASTYRRREGT